MNDLATISIIDGDGNGSNTMNGSASGNHSDRGGIRSMKGRRWLAPWKDSCERPVIISTDE